MGNALAARNKSAKVMKVDGATFKVKPPARAIKVLRNHPGHDLLESEEVKRLGVRARPLGPDAPLRPGKLYFLVELPRPRAPRRAWSGKLQVAGAKERLENLRRSMSDLSSLASRLGDGEADHETAAKEAGGAVRVRVRLPKVELEKLMRESRDAAEAAEKIMELCVEKDGAAPPPKALRWTISAVTTDQLKEVCELKERVERAKLLMASCCRRRRRRRHDSVHTHSVDSLPCNDIYVYTCIHRSWMNVHAYHVMSSVH